MRKMRLLHLYSAVLGTFCYLLQVNANFDGYVTLSHDGPVVIGGTITFRADVYKYDGTRPSGTFSYEWKDDGIIPHKYTPDHTRNTTAFWSISYPAEIYSVGIYIVEVKVIKKKTWFNESTRVATKFAVTSLLNGNMTIKQENATTKGNFVSSSLESTVAIDIRKGDLSFIMTNATSISTFWFIDCQYYGHTENFIFNYNFTDPDRSHTIEALVVASFDPPTTTTSLPDTTTSTTVNPPWLSVVSNSSINSTAISTTSTATPFTTSSTTALSTITTPNSLQNTTVPVFGNISFPFVCLNSSIVPPDPHNIYGYFQRTIEVRAPVTDISVDGTNWIQPWAMLNLNVTCEGSGPFIRCLQFHRGNYNVTGNETCGDGERKPNCNFSIIHYFLEPSDYTIVIILTNDISTNIHPVTINIYQATTQPQLSVIVVPVLCSLVALVLIIFGIAYYIQSRARFTVEVADFDFGQSNPDMEYKTFAERLRDSFDSAVRPGSNRISVRAPYYGSMNR
ncbi:uncharacterized protein LOC107264636 isoform X2 [Cephus cinctus]|uniref:Uncharacterized protein LOC107264636 isoform X2 n=1 Tax=Cephus cinctus TaxID=211228 RepID=A0AAJ7BLG7_CEPCN|nr:uncharacterized protein LOC107264636 isoform X2 [Cephus cinctus]